MGRRGLRLDIPIMGLRDLADDVQAQPNAARCAAAQVPAGQGLEQGRQPFKRDRLAQVVYSQAATVAMNRRGERDALRAQAM